MDDSPAPRLPEALFRMTPFADSHMTRKAVIMAGGEGTRLRPLTDDVPKPFLPVAGKPAIEYGLDALVRAGIRDVIVTTFYKPQRLIDRLAGGSRLGARIFYSVEDEAMGTAGGVAKCRAFLDSTFVVMSGDVLADVDVRALVQFHEKVGADVSMALTEVEDPTQFGIVETDASGRVTRFQEKPRTREEAFSRLVNAGVYVLDPRALALVPDDRPFDFSKNLFPALLEAGRPVFGQRLDGVWMDVGRPADLLRAGRIMGERHHGGPYRHRSAVVAAGADATRCDLYADARVAPGAIVEDSILYDGATVGAGAFVRRCILAAGSHVDAGAVVEDAILGAGARVAANVRATGVRVDAHTVHLG